MTHVPLSSVGSFFSYVIDARPHEPKANISMFNFLCLLHVSNPKVHLQEDSCIYSYGIVGY